MDVNELITAVGAELVSNRAIARNSDGERVVVAQVVGDAMVLTPEGEAMAAEIKPAPEPKPAAKTTKSKTTKAAAAPTPEE
jgi:hypothetical protein